MSCSHRTVIVGAGIAGLALTDNPGLTVMQIRESMQGSGRKIGPLSYPGGWNQVYGFGVVDASQVFVAPQGFFSDGFESGDTSAWSSAVP